MSGSEEDEAPAQLSFREAKTAAEEEMTLVAEQKSNDLRVTKLKRSMRHAIYFNQKGTKKSKLSKPDDDEEDDDFADEENLEELVAPPVPTRTLRPRPQQPKKKVYKDLNIEVSTLDEVKSGRAGAAKAFKDKRLAKAHREPVKTNLVHQEKLKAAGKL